MTPDKAIAFHTFWLSLYYAQTEDFTNENNDAQHCTSSRGI